MSGNEPLQYLCGRLACRDERAGGPPALREVGWYAAFELTTLRLGHASTDWRRSHPMRHATIAACVIGLAFASRMFAGTDVDPEIKKVLDRAVTALGGTETLTKHPGISWKGKGKYRQADIAVVFE